MRWWPFNRRRTARPSADAIAADYEASRALRDARALTSRADDVADRLRLRKARNGFGASVREAFRGV
jgi:hypothetical protein